MIRLLAATAAFVSSAFLPAAFGLAQTPGAYYVAVPATAPVRTQMMTRSTPWTLQGQRYVAYARAAERDGILCELVAKNAGELSSFSAGGKAFDADALARCNAKARRNGAAMAAAN